MTRVGAPGPPARPAPPHAGAAGATGWDAREAVPATSRPAGRAAPLPPAERRARVIAAAIPLVADRGAAVTTREIADAAGIAEGTIFRVFDDKRALLDAVVAAVIDPVRTIEQLDRMASTDDLRALLHEVVAVLAGRMAEIWRVLWALHIFGPPGAGTPGPHQPADHRDSGHEDNDLLELRVEELFGPLRSQLRLSPHELARSIRMVVIAATHPRISGGEPMAPDAIVALLLDGVRAHAP